MFLTKVTEPFQNEVHRHTSDIRQLENIEITFPSTFDVNGLHSSFYFGDVFIVCQRISFGSVQEYPQEK